MMSKKISELPIKKITTLMNNPNIIHTLTGTTQIINN